jgi:hypothetical protein
LYSFSASKDNPPSVPSTSTDIVEMEPKVTKQSKEVIKSQEHILKKIQRNAMAEKRTFEECRTSNAPKTDKSMSFEHRKDDAHIYSFYILLRERTAKKLEKSYSSSNLKFTPLLQGEILIRNVTTAADESNGLIRLHPYDKPNYFCDCPFGDVKRIDEEEAKLLLPIQSAAYRLNLFKDKSLLKNGKKMTLGSYVDVKVRSVGGASKQELRGIVRYKGPLPKESGTWFGVELLVSRTVR